MNVALPTMLLEHAELCYRANMSVNWVLTDKQPHLDVLTKEIEVLHKACLDAYLQPFIAGQIPREAWLMSLAALPGLDGVSTPPDDTEG